MKPIFIIGYMGVGKTTVGKKLSHELGIEFIDLDKYIQNKYRKTVSELFKEKGEEGFRKIEQAALNDVAYFEDVLVSTGGGAPCFFDNMELMNKAGVTVYIQAEPEELAVRLLASKNVRPLVEGKSKEELIPFITKHLADRERYYGKADIVVKTDRLITKQHVGVTVKRIMEELKKMKK
ncbi:MAG: shikimate kinase [Petrimonas sp.]|nr:shikimate kinase [Petrimonas sp.]